jgi:hypothetical protein
MYICSRFKGEKKKSFFLCPFFFPGLSSDQCTQVLCLYCNNSVHCEFQLKNVVTQHQKFNIPDQNSKRKIPTVSLSHNATVAATGFRAYERYASRQKSTRERARERASERERESAREITGGVREEDELAKKKRTRQAGKRERRGQRIIY